MEAQVLRVALAAAAEEVGCTPADAAHVGAVTRALEGVLNETLENIYKQSKVEYKLKKKRLLMIREE